MKDSSKVIAHIVKFLDILSDSTFFLFFLFECGEAVGSYYLRQWCTL
jgi:hypothetical protein